MATLIGTFSGAYATYRATTASEAENRETAARGAARIMQSELFYTQVDLSGYVEGRWPRLGNDFGVRTAVADQQLVAAELATEDWEEVVDALALIERIRATAPKGIVTEPSALKSLKDNRQATYRRINDAIDALSTMAGGNPYRVS